MKRLLSFCAAALMSISVLAQYAVDTTSLSEPRLLKSKGCRIYVGEEKLNKNEAAAYFSDLGGKDRSADYLSYRKAYNTGVGLTIAGSVVAGAGFGLTLVGGVAALVTMPFVAIGGNTDLPDELSTLINIGGYSMLSGVAFLGAGIPLLCVYKKRIRNFVNDYNAQFSESEAHLSFGCQSSGIGFAYQF